MVKKAKPRIVTEATRKIYGEVYSYFEGLKEKYSLSNQEMFERTEAFMLKKKDTNKFSGKNYKSNYIKYIIEHKLYLKK